MPLQFTVVNKMTAKKASDNSQQPANNQPVPTGLMGGNGEFYYFPDLAIYAAMVNGQADAFQLTPDNWEMMKNALLPVTAVKAQIVKATEAQAAPKIFTYTVTMTVQFETTEILDPATDLTYDTVANMATIYGFSDKLKTPFKLSAGKAKGGTRSTTGEGSGFYKAESVDQLKPLNPKERLVVEYAIKNGGEVPLDKWQQFGYNERQSFVNAAIGFKQKGFMEGVTAAGGTFRFYLDRLNFSLQDALNVKKAS